jgi:hypothetical protein
LLALLQIYARAGLAELRALNPITRGKSEHQITKDD